MSMSNRSSMPHRVVRISQNRTADQPHEFLGCTDFSGQGSILEQGEGCSVFRFSIHSLDVVVVIGHYCMYTYCTAHATRLSGS